MIACTRPTSHERWQIIGVQWRFTKKKKKIFLNLCVQIVRVYLSSKLYIVMPTRRMRKITDTSLERRARARNGTCKIHAYKSNGYFGRKNGIRTRSEKSENPVFERPRPTGSLARECYYILHINIHNIYIYIRVYRCVYMRARDAFRTEQQFQFCVCFIRARGWRG